MYTSRITVIILLIPFEVEFRPMNGKQNIQTRAVIVLGMHRSGTSSLMGSLIQAGLHVGQVNLSAPHNRKGNREYGRIVALHGNLLQSSGGSWDEPPLTVTWEKAHTAEQDVIIELLSTDCK